MRKKLIGHFIVIVLVFLGPTLMFINVNTQEASARNVQLEKLQTIALYQSAHLNAVIDRYIERVNLITSRTALRNNIKAFQEDSANIEAQNQINKIINDAKISDNQIEEINIIGFNGTTIGSTSPANIGTSRASEAFFSTPEKPAHIETIFLSPENEIRAQLIGPMFLNGELIGISEVISRNDGITALTENYAGFGETGELMLLELVDEDTVRYLHPLRFNRSAALTEANTDEADTLQFMVAHSDNLSLNQDGITDYRNEEVMFSSVKNQTTDWVLVAKIDRSELAGEALDQTNVLLFILVSINLLCLLSWAIMMRPNRASSNVNRFNTQM